MSISKERLLRNFDYESDSTKLLLFKVSMIVHLHYKKAFEILEGPSKEKIT